jgi:hypothetical protein
VVSRSIAARLVAASLLLASSACTPMRWEHPQLGIASAETDTQKCDYLAWRESWRYSHAFGYWDFPRYYRGRDGRLRRAYPFYRRDPWFEEMWLRDYCMRSKGYRMVPVPG